VIVEFLFGFSTDDFSCPSFPEAKGKTQKACGCPYPFG